MPFISTTSGGSVVLNRPPTNILLRGDLLVNDPLVIKDKTGKRASGFIGLPLPGVNGGFEIVSSSYQVYVSKSVTLPGGGETQENITITGRSKFSVILYVRFSDGE